MVPGGPMEKMMGKSENPWEKPWENGSFGENAHGENQLILELLFDDFWFSRKSTTRGIYREYVFFVGGSLNKAKYVICNNLKV